MIGQRVYSKDGDDFWLEPGEYGKHPCNGNWYARPPTGTHIGNLAAHEVTEHGDGSITVAPSILITASNSVWHGYLEKGVWREC